MTREEAAAWLARAPSWTQSAVRDVEAAASAHWDVARRDPGEVLSCATAGALLVARLVLDGPRIASDAAREVAIIAAMWPRAPGDVLAEMRG